MLERYAYITGADRGLGLALTKVLLKESYKVFAGSYIDWPELPQLKKKYEKKLTVLPLDVSDPESVKAAAENIKKNTEKIDILFNNAGIYYKNAGTILEELDFKKMIETYEVNSLGPLRVTHSVISLLLEGSEKKLVNISSEAASCNNCWRVKDYGYCMSKAALNKQSAILQNHLKDYGVKVFAIHPGWMKSYIEEELNEKADLDPLISAKKIYDLIKREHKLDGPIYLDYQGNEIDW